MMKTPREILFSKHRTAGPKLDSIRATALGKLNNEGTNEQRLNFVTWFLGCSQTAWRELIFPARRTWAGFAAAWLLIAVVNFADSDRLTSEQAKMKPTPVNMMLAWQQQQKAFAEFNNEAKDGDKPKPQAPKSRSDRQSLLPIA